MILFEVLKQVSVARYCIQHDFVNRENLMMATIINQIARSTYMTFIQLLVRECGLADVIQINQKLGFTYPYNRSVYDNFSNKKNNITNFLFSVLTKSILDFVFARFASTRENSAFIQKMDYNQSTNMFFVNFVLF